MSEGEPYFPELDVLLRCLDLDALDRDLFLGDPGPGQGRLFGGMVAAQSVVAAGRTVAADRPLHSLHAYFLRPGNHAGPLRFVVDPMRDGRTFTTRRVKAHQAGEAIFSLEASFARPEDGIEHQLAMPQVPPPEELEDWDLLREKAGEAPSAARGGPVEVRVGDPIDPTDPSGSREPIQRSWIRVRGRLPDDPLLHTAMLVYMTDRTIMGAIRRAQGLLGRRHMGASLDHALWIHRPVVLDDWLLSDSVSPAAHAARSIAFASLYYRDGRCLATVAQEALIRPLR